MTGTALEKIEYRVSKGGDGRPTDIKTPVKIVAASLTAILANLGTSVDLERAIFYGLFPEDFGFFSRKISLCRLTEEDKADIVLKILLDIHRNWASQSQARFFNPRYEDEQYLFMPAELVGLENLMKGYIFVQDIARVLDLETGIRVLEEAYGRILRQYKAKWNISSTEALADHLQHCDMELGMDIRAWKAKSKVAERLAIQIVKVNGLPERW